MRQGHTALVYSIAFSPDGKRVLTCSRYDTVRLWETSSGHKLAQLVQSLGWGYGVAFSPDGTRILIGSHYKTALLWDVGSGRVSQLSHSDGVIRVTFSPDGTLALTGSVDQTAILWEASSGRELACLDAHTAIVYTMAFSPNGRLAITCDTNGRVCLWQVCLPELGRLMGIYVASYAVESIHWEDETHVVLADTGGPAGYPHFYYLTLEGMGEHRMEG
jgi:WD40 repeat protein